MHHAYDAEPASVYLIRPDGYLGFRAGWADRHVLPGGDATDRAGLAGEAAEPTPTHA